MDEHDDRLVRLPYILGVYPVSKSTWHAGVASGRFPKPFVRTGKLTMWRKADIDQLLYDPALSSVVPPVAAIPKPSGTEREIARTGFRGPINLTVADLLISIALALASCSKDDTSQLMAKRFEQDRNRLARTGKIPGYVATILCRVG